MLVRPLSTNERAELPGLTHVAIITANELTQATAAAAQTINVCAVKPGDIVYRAVGIPVVPFQNTLDTPAFNSDTVSFGDVGGGVAVFLAATEANIAGPLRVMGNTAKLYTAADTLTITVNSMTGKALVNLNRGEYHVFFCLTRTDDISKSIARTGPTKA